MNTSYLHDIKNCKTNTLQVTNCAITPFPSWNFAIPVLLLPAPY